MNETVMFDARQPTEVARPLLRDRSFWGMLCTQFLGAFNDNLYKQMMLLLAIPVAAAGAAGVESDVQGWATFVFSLPFVLFSGFAGYLSDRFSKTPIIVACKVAEIVIMALGLVAFYYYDLFGMWGTWTVLFLMATQSAFFGPGKYGILPELFAERDLPRANGLMLMTTFLAIIFGMVSAGALTAYLLGDDGTARNLAAGMFVCVGIAVVGTLTSLLVRRVPPAQPDARLSWDVIAVSRDMVGLLKRDRELLYALLVSSLFWLVSGMAAPTVNRLGLEMLGQNELGASILSGCIALGIMVGAVLAGWLCRRGWGRMCVTGGLTGISLCLLVLGVWVDGPEEPSHLLGFRGSLVVLFLLGVAAAVLAIPVQVFLQARPPRSLKGRMIATMNQANFLGIMISGPLYQFFEALSGWLHWPICSVFWMIMLLVIPAAVLYRLEPTPPPVTGEPQTAS